MTAPPVTARDLPAEDPVEHVPPYPADGRRYVLSGDGSRWVVARDWQPVEPAL